MLTTQDRILIETRVGNEGPSTGVAYLLWFFLGLFSAHRFYLGKPLSAFLQILSCLVLVGFVWVLLDAFSIPRFIRARQGVLRERLTAQALAALPKPGPAPIALPA